MALTKVTGGTISSTSSYQVGVITATKFVGPIETTDATITGGSITATSGTFSGNVSIAGTLTYEDVTSIDSVGIITARKLIDANNRLDVVGGANIDQLNVTGVSTLTGTLNVDAGSAGMIDFGDITSAYGRLYADSTGTFIGSKSNHALILRTNNTERVRILNDGKVGIGTNVPASLLHLENSAPVLTVKAINASSGLRINVKGQSTGQLFRIQDDNTTKFVLEESGDVGLGTGTPSGTSMGSNTGVLHLYNLASSNTALKVQHDTVETYISSDNNDATFATRSNHPIQFQTNSTERLRIKADGLVGIATASPSHALTVYGAGNSGGVRIENNHTTTTVSGNTASGSYPHTLLLTNYNRAAANRIASIGFDVPTSGSHANATIAFQATDTNGNGDLQFWLERNNSSEEKLRIKSSGQVLIGSQTSTRNEAKLQVHGTSDTNYIVMQNTSASDSDGNRYGKLIYRGTQSGGEVTDLVHLVAAHDGSSDDQKGMFIIKNNDGSDGNSPTETFRIKSDGNVAINSAGTASNLLDVRKDATSVKTHIGTINGTLASMPNSSEYGISLVGNNAEFQLHKDGSGDYKLVLGTYQGSIDIPLVFRTGSRSERMRITNDGKVRVGSNNETGHCTFSVTDQSSSIRPAIEAGGDGATTGTWSFATRYSGSTNDYYANCISTNYSSGRSVYGHGVRGSRNVSAEKDNFGYGASEAFTSTLDNFNLTRKALTMDGNRIIFWTQGQGSGTGEAGTATAPGNEVKMYPRFCINNDGYIAFGSGCTGAGNNGRMHLRQDGDVTSTLGGSPASLWLEASTGANWADGEAGAEICFKKGGDITGAIRAEHDRTGGDHSFEDAGLGFYTAPASENPTATRKFRILSTGNATLTGTLTDGSDVRLKTDVVGITSALSKVNQMRGVEYKLSSVALDNCGMRDREDGLKNLGVIANEIESILPQVVQSAAIKGLDGTNYKGVSYSRIVPVLIEAIKELSAKVTALEGS